MPKSDNHHKENTIPGTINTAIKNIEECGDSANCRCCTLDGHTSKTFLPLSMLLANDRYHQNHNNHVGTPESSASSDQSFNFNHISFELSPPPPQTDTTTPPKSSTTRPDIVWKTGTTLDTSIVIVDSSSDDDDNHVLQTPWNPRRPCTTIKTPLAPSSHRHQNDSLHSGSGSCSSGSTSPEAEWDGSLDHHQSRRYNDQLPNSPTERQSSFIASSNESNDDESNDDHEEKEEEWEDSDTESVDPMPVAMEELIRRTNEIIILSSDDDDDNNMTSHTKPRRAPAVAIKKPVPSQPSIQRQPSGSSKVESKLAFRKRRVALSQQLLIEFDQMAFGSQLLLERNDIDRVPVTLTWSNKLRTTAGLTRLSRVRQFPNTTNPTYCTSDDKLPRIAVIELSCKVIDDETRLRATLLHEMCHAAAWVVDAVAKPAHGSGFQTWAQRATRAIPDIVVTTTHNYEIAFKYQWVCVNYPDQCNVMIQRHSRSVNVERHMCGRCHGRLRPVTK